MRERPVEGTIIGILSRETPDTHPAHHEQWVREFNFIFFPTWFATLACVSEDNVGKVHCTVAIALAA